MIIVTDYCTHVVLCKVKMQLTADAAAVLCCC